MKAFTSDRRRIYILPFKDDIPSAGPRGRYQSGKTVAEIAEELGCDRRTAARLIRENLGEDAIGKWKDSHRKISAFREMIDSYLEKHLSDVESVHSLSQMLYRNLIEQGYTGSERTLRNHLNKHEKVIQYVQGKQLREGEHIYVKGYKYR